MKETKWSDDWLDEILQTYDWPRSKPWVKLYRKWTTTDSHMGVGGMTLGCGALILAIVNSAPCPIDGDGTAWLVTRAGHVLTISDLARETRFSARQVRQSVNCLVNCQTFTRRRYGAETVYGIPNFAHWQTTPEAIRKAREREANAKALDALTPEFAAGWAEAKGMKLVSG